MRSYSKQLTHANYDLTAPAESTAFKKQLGDPDIWCMGFGYFTNVFMYDAWVLDILQMFSWLFPCIKLMSVTYAVQGYSVPYLGMVIDASMGQFWLALYKNLN